MAGNIIGRGQIFQSTLPGWGATSSWSPASTRVRHFNPRSPDGERLRRWPHAAVIGGISIHAPRMGSDSPSALPKSGFSHFNPRSPDGERLPVSRFAMPSPSNFNPRSPDGERRGRRAEALLVAEISIHAPRMGSDQIQEQDSQYDRISIHAPRMGSDGVSRVAWCRRRNFNLRSPDGERPYRFACSLLSMHFNPRSPDGERLFGLFYLVCGDKFQSTLPGWGATWALAAHVYFRPFQSTLPGWGATRAD